MDRKPKPEKGFPRGIAPELLLSQVRNTMPYLFEKEVETSALGEFPPAKVLRKFESEVDAPLSHFEYYRLCLSSHYLTCGTPVPTDVDNQIRLKLWPAKLPLEIVFQMVDLVLASRKWDFTQVSTRFTYGAKGTEWEKEALNGHLGEWFTVSCAAYCALGQYSDDSAKAKRDEVFLAIEDEVRRHAEIFGSLWRAKDGIGCLKASASIAHNCGDLDRVMDMWKLDVGDRLRLSFYKLGALPFDSEKRLRYRGSLWVAGELYKSPIDGSSMALENHRHFALRNPRSLRERPEFVVPTAPFFDDWGKAIVSAFGVSEKTLEILETLRLGWDRQPGTMAYGRALCGMISVEPSLEKHPLVLEAMQVHAQRVVLGTPRDRFEKRWAEEALRWMEEIPSRAQ